MPPDQAVNAVAATAGSTPQWAILIPYALIMGIFYFLVIRPQKQKQQETKQLIGGVKKNDQVVTTGGIHGTVVNVKDTTVVIRIDDNAKMEVDKEALVTVKKTG